MTGYHRTLTHSMAAARADRGPASVDRDPAVGMAAIVAVALAAAMLLASLPGMAAVPASDVAPAPMAAPDPGRAALAPSSAPAGDGSAIDERRGR